MPTPLVQKRKIPGNTAIEITVELAPYIQAYKHYKHVLDVQGGSNDSPDERICKSVYERLKFELRESLAVETLNWEDVVELAMEEQGMNDTEMVTNSDASWALADSYVELLGNAVDEALAKHLASANSIKPVKTLKATLRVIVDDKTNPDNVTISCVDNGRGFNPDFLKKVDTSEARKSYTTNKAGSNKKSEAKVISEIPLFVGGQGQGLRMLIRKVSDIAFGNVKDLSGKIQGAGIIVTTSKSAGVVNLQQPEEAPMLVLPMSPVFPQKRNHQREVTQDYKQKNKSLRDSPMSINTDFSDLDDNRPEESDRPKNSLGCKY